MSKLSRDYTRSDSAETSSTSSNIFSSTDLSDHLSNCTCDACANPDHFRDDVDRAGDVTDGGSTSAAATASLQEMSEFLETGYWGNSVGLRHNVGTSGLDANNGVLYYNVSGFNALQYGGGSDADGVSEARAELIRDAFAVYGSVLGIEFIETTSTDSSVVDFFFSDNKDGAYAGSTRYSDGTIYYSYVNIAESWSGGTSTYDDYTLQTIFHEIGHALGLGHQGDYNGTGGYASDAQFELDSWQASMMSYFSQGENTAIDASYEFLQTPMAVDWLALDSIYGQFGYGVDNAFTGDTVFGFNTNISEDESRIWNAFSDYANRTASTIIDGGGIDTLDVSGYSADQKIDLTVQSASQTYQNTSDIGGRLGNLTLAVGTVIENAVGGSGDDTIIGNDADNIFAGGAGDDTLIGFLGDDTFYGDTGFDTVVYNSFFGNYAFSLVDTAIEVIGEGIDLVFDTIESFVFSDVTYSFSSLFDLFSDSNSAPVAADDAITLVEGTSGTLDVLSNDTDADLDALTITAVEGQAIAATQTVALASGASVTLNADGTLSYLQNDAFVSLEDGETALESFSYTVADTSGETDTADVFVTIEGETPEPVDAGPIGQSGIASVVQANSSQWHQVTFDETIENAVVVMGPMTFNGGQPGTTRVRNVTDTGFEFQIDEWEYLDGYHILEDIGWLAVSEGTHTLEGGLTIVAGTQTVGTGYGEVAFGEDLTDAIVFTEVSSVNEDDAVTTRIKSVDGDGFRVKLQEEESGGAHVNETVSWIALETGVGDGIDVFKTADQLNQNADSFVFNTDFNTGPVLLGDLQTTDGNDTSNLRIKAINENGVSLFVEEEKSRDSEIAHTSEVGGYAALSQGLLFENLLVA